MFTNYYFVIMLLFVFGPFFSPGFYPGYAKLFYLIYYYCSSYIKFILLNMLSLVGESLN